MRRARLVERQNDMKRRITTGAAKKTAWDVFSRYIRLRDAIGTTGTTTHAKCVTCGKPYPISGVGCIQAGHFLPGRRNAILLDERNCHAQCYICNVRLKGNTMQYLDFMLQRYGHNVVDELRALDRTVVQILPHQWKEREDYFRELTKNLEQRAGIINH